MQPELIKIRSDNRIIVQIGNICTSTVVLQSSNTEWDLGDFLLGFENAHAAATANRAERQPSLKSHIIRIKIEDCTI